MQKEDTFSWIAFLVTLGFILGMSFGFIMPAIKEVFKYDATVNIFFLIAVSIILGFICNALFIEIGHIIGGIIGGYKIVSCTVFRFSTFKRKDEKGNLYTKFKFPKNYDGLTGETVMTPKSEKAKPTLSMFMPLFFFLLELLGTVLLFIYVKNPEASSNVPLLIYVKYGAIIFTTVGGAMMIHNYFPAKLEWMNDGYRILILNKKSNIDTYNKILTAKTAKFFEESVGDIDLGEDVNDLKVDLAMYKLNEIAVSNSSEAIEIIDKFTADQTKISKGNYSRLLILKSYILLMNDDLEVAKDFYLNGLKEEQRKLIIGCNNPLCLATYILYEGLVEKSESEVEIALNKEKKALGHVTQAEKDDSIKLLKAVKEKLNISEEE